MSIQALRRGTVAGRGGVVAPTVVVTDDFNRADSSTSLGTATTGQVWSALVGTWGISTNRAYCVSKVSGDVAVIDAGITDAYASVLYPVGFEVFSLVGRLVDSNNYYMVHYESGTAYIYKVIAGVTTELGNAASSLPANSVFGIKCVGTTISYMKDDAVVLSRTNAELAGTKWGLRNPATSPTVRWDNLSVVTA